MLPGINKILMSDPLIIMEFFTLIASFCYLIKLTFGNSACPSEDGFKVRDTGCKVLNTVIGEGFSKWSYWGVGRLIPTPKRSLRKQRLNRIFV